jgi:hypothetical protein
VDQVVGDLHPIPDTLEAAAIGDVADVQLTAGLLETGGPARIPDQAADTASLGRRRVGEPASDEAGGSRDEEGLGDAERLASGMGRQPRVPPPRPSGDQPGPLNT